MKRAAVASEPDLACEGRAAPERANVVAIVVTFEPDEARLCELLHALLPQVRHVLVVDNSLERPPCAVEDDRVTCFRMAGNMGLAAAQNVGIEHAFALGAKQVLLLDQDSVPAPQMVDELCKVLEQALSTGITVAAVGPMPTDGQGRCEGFVQFRSGRYRAVLQREPGRHWISCDFLIASGSLIPAAILASVGPMDERLFIDKIDTEWCLRAAAAGHALLGAPEAVLHHRLGERFVRIWFGQWRELSHHRPFRYYYMVRNSLLIRRMPHATPPWRRADARQLRSIVLYFGLLAPQRFASMRMLLLGAWHGWRGRVGRMP